MAHLQALWMQLHVHVIYRASCIVRKHWTQTHRKSTYTISFAGINSLNVFYHSSSTWMKNAFGSHISNVIYLPQCLHPCIVQLRFKAFKLMRSAKTFFFSLSKNLASIFVPLWVIKFECNRWVEFSIHAFHFWFVSLILADKNAVRCSPYVETKQLKAMFKIMSFVITLENHTFSLHSRCCQIYHFRPPTTRLLTAERRWVVRGIYVVLASD